MKRTAPSCPPGRSGTVPSLFAAAVLAGAGFLPAAAAPVSVSYSRDVQPVLAEYCLNCHGPDERQRKGELRLDDEASAKAGRPHGPAIVPGRPEASALLARVLSHDPAEVMPPPKSGRRPTAAQVDLLRRWIAEGAVWGRHWAFESPVRPPVPAAGAGAGAMHPIDALVGQALAAAGLSPSPEAPPETLIRRLHLDLTGLPPSPEEIDAALADFARSPATGPAVSAAYERLVDRLLASPHFGERWGRHWLDLARYADSDGYEKDHPRPTAFRFRDWVIDAINADLPFDQFTVEQLAGDLLPGATESQRVATGFHRQTLTNKEGGVDQEEYRCKATVDRTHTAAAVWLGLTLGCAECHSHKYDPVSQREFYQFYAFFNDVAETDLPLPTATERSAHTAELARWQSRIAGLESRLRTAGGGTNAAVQRELAAARENEPRLKPATAPVLMRNPRVTRVHVRGDFLQPGETVEPGTPAALPALHPRAARADRLDLARWLVSPENPLTSRVTVNQVWRQLFGRGLVATENDFGLRGDRPSHPALLDWLAVEFRELGWSRKQLIRRIVTSATYRQSSAWRSDLAAVDPRNVLLARQGRFRLEAEIVRDVSLAAAGRLNRRIGGPSFKPVLAPDLAKLSYANGLDWQPARGADRFRRGLYIHFQRTVPFPMLVTFDAPEAAAVCTRRERSTSPLQALTLLNNETFLDCARGLGRRMRAGAGTTAGRVELGFRLVTGRAPGAAEQARLVAFWEQQAGRFTADPAAAAALAGSLTEVAETVHDPVDTATAVAVARVLLNLDETLTRE